MDIEDTHITKLIRNYSKSMNLKCDNSPTMSLTSTLNLQLSGNNLNKKRILEARAIREMAELNREMLEAEKARILASKEANREAQKLEQKKILADKLLIRARLLEGIAQLEKEYEISVNQVATQTCDDL